VLGENVKMLMPSPHREAHDTYIGDYLATGERRIIGIGREVQGQRKNGELFPMHLGVSEVETPDEQFFVGIVRDLSEENALRAALSENRHFLADVIENSPDATYVKDRAGRYLLVNRAQRKSPACPVPRRWAGPTPNSSRQRWPRPIARSTWR
jgi:PAS domain-containing protein